MAIKTKRVRQMARPHYFRTSAITKRYCIGEGLEIGAAAHNSFGLPGSRNVSFSDDTHLWNEAEVNMCGEYCLVDIVAEGDDIPVDNESQDYVVNSHVLEHFVNPVKAIAEWYRVLKDGGILVMIVPHRRALLEDSKRAISQVSVMERAFREGWTYDDIPVDAEQATLPKRGHYYVFTLDTLKELVAKTEELCAIKFTTLEALLKDDKVQNGHMLVLQKVAVAPKSEPLKAKAEEPKPKRGKKVIQENGNGPAEPQAEQPEKKLRVKEKYQPPLDEPELEPVAVESDNAFGFTEGLDD